MESILNEKQRKLWMLMQKINRCWYEGRPLELSDFFHDDIVFNSPDFLHQDKGREQCIRSYADFMDSSRILLYKEHNPGVQMFRHTAIVTYDFEMKYEQNNVIYHETGTDIFVFEQEKEQWKAVWRVMGNIKNVT